MELSQEARAEAVLAGLLDATAAGDRQAFRRLYDQTSAKLFGVVLRIMRDRPAAMDVLQESYLRVWQRAASYAPESGRAMTWLVAIARHAAIDQLRKRTERPLAGEAPKEEAGPDEGERDFLLHDRLGDCLARLAEPTREAVVLAYTHGYSREELAARYGRPVPTIKTWLRRALLSLRACLEPT